MHRTQHDTPPLHGNKTCREDGCVLCVIPNWCTATSEQYVLYHFIVNTMALVKTVGVSLKASEDALISNNSMKIWYTVTWLQFSTHLFSIQQHTINSLSRRKLKERAGNEIMLEQSITIYSLSISYNSTKIWCTVTSK